MGANGFVGVVVGVAGAVCRREQPQLHQLDIVVGAGAGVGDDALGRGDNFVAVHAAAVAAGVAGGIEDVAAIADEQSHCWRLFACHWKNLYSCRPAERSFAVYVVVVVAAGVAVAAAAVAQAALFVVVVEAVAGDAEQHVDASCAVHDDGGHSSANVVVAVVADASDSGHSVADAVDGDASKLPAVDVVG